MISVITCSRSQDLLQSFRLNVSQTIGTEHEILVTENYINNTGICDAYNACARQAKYLILCFIHEDVRFITKGWGQNLVEHFRVLNEAGVIGVAGSTYKVRMVSSWWQPAINMLETKRANYIQSYKFKQRLPERVFYNPQNEERSKVVSLDGVFLAVKKKVWSQFRFDDSLLKGFHGYDLDFTLRAGNRYGNYVVYDILFEHLSEGVNDQTWLMENYHVHLKNKSLLPACIEKHMSGEDLREVEKNYLEKNFNLALESSLHRLKIAKMFLRLIINSRLFNPNILFMKLFLTRLILDSNKWSVRRK